MIYVASVDPEGKRESDPPTEAVEQREHDEPLYPLKKVVNGHAVQCLDIPPIVERMGGELCVIDLKPGTLTDDLGRSITASSRVSIVDDWIGELITEPVSVRVGHRVDNAIFDAAAAP